MNDKDIVLGVSGGIAAYKACELASRLTQRGARVHVVLTAAARRFVTPLTFQALTQQPVHVSLWPSQDNSQAGVHAAMAHTGLGELADAVLIAPASADLVARLAHGMADDLLTTLVLATLAPILVAPAMNPMMLEHIATRRNIATLRDDFGYTIIEPAYGRMACEQVGDGRLPDTDVLIAALDRALWLETSPGARDFDGRKVLITAGPTREPIDTVRFISNPSSGKMGYALAAAAAARGAQTVLVSGPSRLEAPPGVQRLCVGTTEEMLAAVLAHAGDAALVVGAAAPCDYRAAVPAPRKIKKREQTGARLTLELAPTPDIIAAVGRGKRPGQVVIGFAAETHDVADEARRKLAPKGLDAIVANDVTQSDAGFDTDTNRVLWITPESTEAWPLLSKREVADRILDRAAQMLKGGDKALKRKGRVLDKSG